MENFRGIADESFPSPLTNSLTSNNSRILENISISSNLGLPVAVSTVDRNRYCYDDRYSSIQATYIGGERFSIASESSYGSQLDFEPKGKFHLSYGDRMPNVNRLTGSQRISDIFKKELSYESENIDTLPVESIRAAHSIQGKDSFGRISSLDQVKDLSTDVCFLPDLRSRENKIDPRRPLFDEEGSLLENEKLISFRSLGDSSDEDIDDEEFYDDHLEEYFQQLAFPEMLREDQEEQELSESSPTFKQSSDQTSQVNANNRPSYRPKSEDNISVYSLGTQIVMKSELNSRQSEESPVNPVVSENEGCTEEDKRIMDNVPRFPSNTWEIEENGLREENDGSLCNPSVNNVPYCKNTNINQGSFDLHSLKLGIQSSHRNKTVSDSEAVLHLADGSLDDTLTPKISIQKYVAADSVELLENGFSSVDAYWSPTTDRRICENWNYSEKKKNGALPHSVVYQNEEGKWVTDLAYYTSFDEEQDLNLCRDNEGSEKFRSGSEAIALIAQDEEEFEREHRFMQEEKIDLQNTSGALGDTSWNASINYNLLRRSLTTSDMAGDDASYLRLSLGEFFGQRSEALGCLGGDNNVKRPSFGYFITSPEKREPVALLRESDVSADNLEQDQEQHVLFSDVKEKSRKPVCDGSATFNIDDLETTSQIDENKIFKERAEDTLVHKSNNERYENKIPDCSDTILNMSTIASAIANASVSADPSQLAAMIMALSNKNKQKIFLEASNKERDFSFVNQMLPSHLESNGTNTFDMEKYLKKTEVSKYEGNSDNFLRTGLSGFLNFSLSNKQTTQDFLEVDLHTDSVNVREAEENPDVIFSKETEIISQESFGISDLNKNIEKHWDNKQFIENTPDKMMTKHLAPKTILAFGRSNARESLMDDSTENDISLKAKSSSLKQIASKDMSPLNSLLINGDRETVDKIFSTNAEIPDVGRCEKPILIHTPKPCSYLPVRNSTTMLNWTSTECKEIHGGETQKRNESNCEPQSSDRHMIFEKSSAIGTNHCLTNLKDVSPKRDLQCLEDKQFNFRLSTSPLIHSSPSEVSETSISGFESNFLSSSIHLQKPHDSILSQSVYSSPSMARLTYVSVHDSVVGDISGNSQSDAPSELSTTIVRASPTPLEEQAVENVKEKEPLQNGDKISSVDPSSVDKNIETDQLITCDDKVEDILSNSKVSENSSLRSTQQFTHDELGQVIETLPSKSCFFHPPLSAKIDTPVSCQDRVTQSQEITSTHMLPPYSGSSSHFPLPRNTLGNQYVSVPHFNSQGPASEMQSLSGAVPTLLNRNSLTTPPFNAQQYLGTVSTGNVALPQYHISSSTVCGHSGGYPCNTIPGEHIQNSVAVGMFLGHNAGSGLLGPTSLCNAHSNTLNQNLLSTAKLFSGLPIGTYGIEPRETQIASGFGNVRVPEELKFPHACCVGIASQTSLSIFNPTDRWLQVNIGILCITVDGEKVDLSTCRYLVFKNKTVIQPHSTEEIKVLFMPTHPGIFRCILRVSSWPVSSDLDTIAQAEALASRVVLTAIAENPVIEVEPVKADILDFGDLIYGSWKVLPLKFLNKTHAVIPVRLIINANAIAWRCFTFTKEPVNAALETAFQSDLITQLKTPSVINHIMYASHDGHEFLKIWVIFRSPKKQISSSGNLGPAEEFLARIDVEVDSPSPTTVIKSIALRARVGIARIHAPKDLQSMHLLASVGSSTKQFLPLKNAGNIDVYLNIKISDQFSYFSVNPEKLFLKPEEEQEITVSFTPKDFKTCEESLLKILVQPSGPQYEVMLKGEVDSSGNKYQTSAPSSHYSNVPPILSNKQFMTWGGVALGRTHLQKLALRNNSSTTTQHLRLLIRGQDQDCFQLRNTFGLEEQLTSNCEIRIHPKEDINIFLLFAPTRISCMLAKLEIKQLGIRSQPSIKFSIPLSGYGGTSNLILEEVKKLSDSYTIRINDPIPGKENRIVFSVRNTGSRAAYVKAICFKDSQAKVVLDPQVMRILPNKFVVKEKAQEIITLIYTPTEKEKNCQATSLLSTIYFFGGDEISRQQYRRALLHKPDVIEQLLPEHSLLKNICFDETFQDEQLITEVCDLPEQPNDDVQSFYGNMHKIILSVIGDFTDTSSNLNSLQNCLQHILASNSKSRNSEKHINNVSLDVLPVKGPQGSPLSSQGAAETAQNTVVFQQTWSVQPEHLILKVCGMTKTTGHLHILNNSVRSLKFELSWPAHCLTITPQHGVIDPESRLLIYVSPNPSIATKPSAVPWSGVIYIHCDNGQKVVKVQIREDITKEGPSTVLASKQILTSESPVSHMVKPFTKPPSTEVEIKNKMITFPETEPGATSENYLELENHGDEEVKWNLSSFAPPYVKDVDESGDIFRATYTAFRCSRISGTLVGHGKQKVAITFLPRDRGNYAQFWDVECYPSAASHMKHTLRFQLSGLSVSPENGFERISTDALVKTDNLARPRRRAGSEACIPTTRHVDLAQRGVYAPQDIYIFLPARVGETRTVKVNLRNNSFSTHLLKFLSPREPFSIKLSKYSLRAQHYVNMPVQFKPKSTGKFESLLVVQTDEGKSIGIRLVGEALEKV